MAIRGVWITATDSQVLYSKKNIADAMQFLAETGFNVVFPVVWTRGYTVYPSPIMRQQFGREIDPRFAGRDPLGELVEEARKVGLSVIPWFEYGFMASYSQKGGHLLAKKPEWAARDVTGNLLKKNDFEWMNSFDPDVQNFILSLMLEVINNYQVHGIQGDDHLALPSEGGYDQKTVALYQKTFNQPPPQNPKDWQWLRWRADLVTDFLARVYQSVKSVNPELIVSMSPSVYRWGLIEYLQDTKTWCDRKIFDWIHPQLYNLDFAGYRRSVNRLVVQQFNSQQLGALSPGILLINRAEKYRVNPDDLVKMIAYNRSCGIEGEVFFFYEGLRAENNLLAQVLRDGVYSKFI